MGDKDLMIQNDDVAPIADDFLISMADQAERRIDAVIKIKNVALKVTNARDWTDQNGNPYLQVSGSEKIANLFNMSWRIEEPKYEEEPDGHFTYSIKGIFSLGARTIEVEGTRSSKDPFFNRYDKSQPKDPVTDKYPVFPPHTIDKGDVKKAALTNLYGNGITRMLGIRNLTWDDLQRYAGITKEMVTNKVSYNQREAGEGKPPIEKPKAKTEANHDTAKNSVPVVVQVSEVKARVGKGPYRVMDTKGTAYNTFSDTIAQEAQKAIDSGASVKIEYSAGKFGNDIAALEVIEPRSPGAEG